MMKIKPIIKFNDGAPIALCNRCFVMICNVVYVGEGKGFDGYVVSETKYDHFGDACTSLKKGDTPPIYCNKCSQLLTYSLNE